MVTLAAVRGHGKIDAARNYDWIVRVNVHDSRSVIRRAEASEARALTDLCRASKRHWGYPAAWMEEWAEDLCITAAQIVRDPVFVAESGGQRIGFFGLRRADERWQLEHLWLAPEQIGRGWGRRLFDAAVAEARARGARQLHIKADPNAEPFYRKMGAVRIALEVYELLGTGRELPLMVYAVPPAAP